MCNQNEIVQEYLEIEVCNACFNAPSVRNEAVDEDSETQLDPPQDSKPVELTEKQTQVLGSPGLVDESSGSVENRLESLQLLRRRTSHRRTDVVKSRQRQSCDQ